MNVERRVNEIAMLRVGRTEMRCQKLGLTLLTFFSLGVLALPAHALQIRLCVPTCLGTATLPADPNAVTEGVNHFTSLSDQTSTADGVTTTTFPVTATYQGFNISVVVVSQQSGTLQRIIFNPNSVITAPSANCSSTSPCRIEVMATSQTSDFPAPKPAGGFPAGAFMSGKFEGTGLGDSISATSESSGLRAVFEGEPQLVNTDVLNLKPGTDPGNTGSTLPHTCTGNPTCKFTTGFKRSNFWTELTETVQQECGTNNDGTLIDSCLTRLRTRINVEFKTANNRVTLPLIAENTNVDKDELAAFLKDPRVLPTKIPTKELIKSAIVPLGDLNVGHLLVGSNSFALTAKFKLGSDGAIDPSLEESYFSVGSFSLLILSGKFKKLLQGKLYTFLGKVDGLDVAATFVRDRTDPALWSLVLGVHGVQLPRPQPSDPLTPVKIGVGSDSGTDLVQPKVIR